MEIKCFCVCGEERLGRQIGGRNIYWEKDSKKNRGISSVPGEVIDRRHLSIDSGNKGHDRGNPSPGKKKGIKRPLWGSG